MSEKKEVAADVWENSVAIKEALRHVTYLFIDQVIRTLTYNALYTELMD